MDVVQLLPHHYLRFDKLRMIAFFPNLIIRVLFMGAFEKGQQLQQLSVLTAVADILDGCRLLHHHMDALLTAGIPSDH